MSLRLKLSLAYAALATVCTFALGGLGLRLQQQSYLSNLDERLTAEAALGADLAATRVATGAPLGPVVRQIAEATGARVTIIAPNGVVLADSVLDAAQMENHAGRPEVAAALGGQPGEDTRLSESSHVASHYVALPIQNDGRPIGVMRLAVPLTEIDAALRRGALALVGLTIVGAALTTLLTFIVTRWLTAPLRQLTALVRQAAAGQFAGRLPVRSRDELGDLAQSFNHMADELDRLIRSISNQRDEMSIILGGMSDGVLVIDRDQRVQRINQTALDLFGAAAGDVIGRPLIEATRDHELAEAAAESVRLHAAHRRLIERSGARVLSATVTPMTAGELDGALITLHDVTELRRLEQVRRQFVANVSHELRTPLANVKLMVETLQEVPDDPTLRADFLQRINTEIDSLTQLVRELLDLARLESGQAPLTFEWMQLAEVIQRAVGRLDPQAERQSVTLVVEPGVAALPPVQVDGERIEGVLVNLLHNAIKFTPPGGSISVGGEARDDEALIWVRDTGVGIAPEDLPRLFERFYKVDKARSTGGSGLGLAIVKHTVLAHGGRIWAESAPGQGSAFFFTLPLTARVAAPAGD
jgi:two-component system phosphate regulon sensor histidine kinase PhoR